MSTAQEMLRDQGYDGLAIAELARRSGVATKTLYNRYGSKHGVLARAIEEILRDLLSPAEQGDRRTGIDGLLDLVNHSIDKVLEDSVLHTRAANVIVAHPTILLDGEVAAHFYRPYFREIAARGELDPWVDIDRLTRAFFHAITSPYILWATGSLSGEELRASYMLFLANLLAPVTSGHTHDRLARLQQEAGWRVMAADRTGTAATG
jgi:AcrR family transcriptional regulator